jgi:hypothetical protein
MDTNPHADGHPEPNYDNVVGNNTRKRDDSATRIEHRVRRTNIQ